MRVPDLFYHGIFWEITARKFYGDSCEVYKYWKHNKVFGNSAVIQMINCLFEHVLLYSKRIIVIQ